MAITVYTYNDKVLKNSANDKWLKKPEAPAGFVMNAANAEYTTSGSIVFVNWQGPAYPDGYNGNGKQYILVNNNATGNGEPLLYANTADSGGPNAVNPADMEVIGTSTGVLLNNVAGGVYGTYLVWPFQNMTTEQVQAYMTNVTITITDP